MGLWVVGLLGLVHTHTHLIVLSCARGLEQLGVSSATLRPTTSSAISAPPTCFGRCALVFHLYCTAFAIICIHASFTLCKPSSSCDSCLFSFPKSLSSGFGLCGISSCHLSTRCELRLGLLSVSKKFVKTSAKRSIFFSNLGARRVLILGARP